MKTAIVILNWNGYGFLKKFIPILLKYTQLGTDTELIVADNNSTDNSSLFLRENYPSITVLDLLKNNGFAGGYNLALEKINAEYFILLNSDIEVSENWLPPLIDFMDKNPNVAACMPKIKSYHNKNYFEYAGAAGGFIDKYGYPFCRGRIFDKVELDYEQFDDALPVFWATGACMCIRSKLFRELGGFDADFFAHMEEIDLCWRLKNKKYEIYYIPQSTVYHIGGGTLNATNSFKTFLNFRNNLMMLYKNLPQKQLKKTLLVRLGFDYMAFLNFFVTFSFKNAFAILKAHIHFFKSLKKLKQKRKENTPPKIQQFNEILNKSIIFSYYLKKQKTYNEITLKDKKRE